MTNKRSAKPSLAAHALKTIPQFVSEWVVVLAATISPLVASVLLGGGTRQGLLSDGILQILAIPLLVYAVARLTELSLPSGTKFVIAACIAIALVPIVQLIPLPQALLAGLPFQRRMAEILTLTGQERMWAPLSVAPQVTLQSVLTLLPALAVFLWGLQSSYHQRRILAAILMALGAISAFLGLIQIAEGPTSEFRFYEYTNTTEAVGFFANRNHLSAFLNVAWVFSIGWFGYLIQNFNMAPRHLRFEYRHLMPLLICVIVMLVELIGIISARSRAGLLLFCIALLPSIVLGALQWRRSNWLHPRRLIAIFLFLAVAVSSQYALVRLLDRLVDDPLKDARIVFAHRTYVAAKEALPFGTGVGTFGRVYPLFERPVDALLDGFVNRAHNDVLEMVLESGVIALGLAAVLGTWFIARLVGVARNGMPGGNSFDRRLALTAGIAVLLTVAHSFVDYPLRTGAMMATFALCLAFLCTPVGLVEREPAHTDRRHVARDKTSPEAERQPKPLIDPAPSLQQPKAWGDDSVQWPDSWRSKPSDK